MEEIWKDIPGYEGLYKVSSYGRIKSLFFNKHKILKPQYTKSGYQKVGLYNYEKYKLYRIHRLVMLAFVGESELQVNHRNSIRDDNTLTNLEYVTNDENTLHRILNSKKLRCPCCSQIIKKSRK